ncbi:uncharacterized protein BYT42DRAFT_580588 [Radiomyces spectabilis]|uniref:uncharacterized protein n=1 Tax=Radiomyces spectabilis TaxID=64574 RepID=UPI0022205146|nr:uncharacterized protein BYT42DRAFT_580588 [Radiomyces spectabilis]KAI8371531.1 hypothetical protein BYT42DRAFT_580588 [Radiomyces spectabilis]
MENYAKKYVLGKIGDKVHKKPNYRDDPVIRDATNAAIHSHKRHWWQKQPEADIILSENDRHILRTVKQRAWVLDKGVNCGCCNVGLDPIIGMVPVIGDVLGVVMALQLVRIAARADLPRHILLQMMTNIAMDFVIGLTPVAGDLLDVFFKCNWRNAELLEEYLFNRRRDELRAEANVGSSSSRPVAPSAPSPSTSTPNAVHHAEPHKSKRLWPFGATQNEYHTTPAGTTTDPHTVTTTTPDAGMPSAVNNEPHSTNPPAEKKYGTFRSLFQS